MIRLMRVDKGCLATLKPFKNFLDNCKYLLINGETSIFIRKLMKKISIIQLLTVFFYHIYFVTFWGYSTDIKKKPQASIY